jgi:hypothetical protein
VFDGAPRTAAAQVGQAAVPTLTAHAPGKGGGG